ncbi:hypothetical protein GCM10010244_04850 [Streptomyces coeruleorubidus]|nr:hypothetical protein GCM10010244_04850 [Streptomyces bellus]
MGSPASPLKLSVPDAALWACAVPASGATASATAIAATTPTARARTRLGMVLLIKVPPRELLGGRSASHWKRWSVGNRHRGLMDTRKDPLSDTDWGSFRWWG